jgi:HD-GYP domain-containing protein (c-di-GMP phosphodiesterase class II)/DNA-binding CsgD family transcriptional regulator
MAVARRDPVRVTIEPFLHLLALRDAYTARHSERVGDVVGVLGERLGLEGDALVELKQAGWLHDLGKVGVPDAVLLKQGPLSPEEWEAMRGHPEWGAQVLAGSSGLEGVAQAVHAHHERWDGGGYPRGIRGEEIPFAGRVVGVCDALCAITEHRPYRPPIDLAGAATIVRAGAGKNFDPRLVDEVLALAADDPRLFASEGAVAPPVDEHVVARGARFARAAERAAEQPQLAQGLGSVLLAADGPLALLESRERLLALLEEVNPHAGRIADAIESDPGLTAAIMREATKQAQAGNAPTHIPGAIEVLGVRGIAAAVDGLAAFDVLDAHRSSRMDPERFHRHAVAVAHATRSVARAIDHRAPDELAVMALLHDVGKLALTKADLFYPDEVLKGARTPEQRVRAERSALGLDHAAATGVVLRRWGLHRRVAAGASGHHDPGDSLDAMVIRLADLLVHHASGGGVSRGGLLRAAAELDLTLADLRSILFELEARGAPSPRRQDDCPLTRTEVLVLRSVSAGKRNKQIAAELRVTESTVRSHLYHSYSKLGVGDRARAVLVATDRGWI